MVPLAWCLCTVWYDFLSCGQQGSIFLSECRMDLALVLHPLTRTAIVVAGCVLEVLR